MIKKFKLKQDIIIFLDFISERSNFNEFSFTCSHGTRQNDHDETFFYDCFIIKKLFKANFGGYMCGCNFSKKLDG